MSTPAQTNRVAPTFRAGLRATVMALGTITAIAIATLFLSLHATSQRDTAHSPNPPNQPSSYAPLIQYRGTGAPPAPRTTAAAATGYLRAEHSYGAVP